MVCFLG